MRDRLVTQEEPPLYSDYVNQLRRIADNLQEMKIWDSRRNKFNRPRDITGGQQVPVNNGMDWEPTNPSISAVPPTRNSQGSRKRAPQASTEQRVKWRKEGACARCGSIQHWVADCEFEPYKGQNGPPRPGRNRPPARKPFVGAINNPRVRFEGKADVPDENTDDWESVEDSGKE